MVMVGAGDGKVGAGDGKVGAGNESTDFAQGQTCNARLRSLKSILETKEFCGLLPLRWLDGWVARFSK